MNNLLKNFLIIFIVFLFIAALFSLYNSPQAAEQTIGINLLIQQVNQEEIKEIIIAGNQLKITLNNGGKEVLQKEDTESLSTLFKNYNLPPEKLAKINIQVQSESGFDFWLKTLLPFLIPFLFVAAFIYFMKIV